MTEQTQPTDVAELEALLLDHLPASKHYIAPVKAKIIAAMQAAVAKWGTPAGAGADLLRAAAIDLRDAPDLRAMQKATAKLYAALETTPQPTQAQAGAPRVSPEQWQALFDDQKRLVEIANSRADIAESMLKAVQAQAGAVPLTVKEINHMAQKYPAVDLCIWSYGLGVADAERHHGITAHGVADMKGGQDVDA